MELIDVYNDNGKKTGKVVEITRKDNEFEKNEHIGVAIIYIENDNGEFLIQKTSKQKGGLYSSTGGHISHGEEPIETIIRETREELGIDISNDKIIDMGYILVDFPIRFIFYLKKNIDIKKIKLQKEEVESVEYMPIEKIKKLIANNLMHKGHAKVLETVLNAKERINKWNTILL